MATAAACTLDPRYHNLADSSTKEFREDILSYLNACRILEDFGLDMTSYREEIEKILTDGNISGQRRIFQTLIALMDCEGYGDAILEWDEASRQTIVEYAPQNKG